MWKVLIMYKIKNFLSVFMLYSCLFFNMAIPQLWTRYSEALTSSVADFYFGIILLIIVLDLVIIATTYIYVSTYLENKRRQR